MENTKTFEMIFNNKEITFELIRNNKKYIENTSTYARPNGNECSVDTYYEQYVEKNTGIIFNVQVEISYDTIEKFYVLLENGKNENEDSSKYNNFENLNDEQLDSLKHFGYIISHNLVKDNAYKIIDEKILIENNEIKTKKINKIKKIFKFNTDLNGCYITYINLVSLFEDRYYCNINEVHSLLTIEFKDKNNKEYFIYCQFSGEDSESKNIQTDFNYKIVKGFVDEISYLIK